MNRKGFTLIELITIILILGILLAIIVPEITDTINDSKTKAYNTTVESVKAAAKSYFDMSFDTYKSDFIAPGYVLLTIDTLIDEGYLENNIKNPLTGDPLTGSVRITKLAENRYNYEFIE